MLVIITLMLWEALPRTGLIDQALLPAASTVFIAMGNLLMSGELLLHISISLERALVGFASEHTEKAITHAIELAKLTKAELHAVYVISLVYPLGTLEIKSDSDPESNISIDASIEG